MGKPRLIIIIRHGQSEGNKNRDIHQTVPDHRVKLTSEGWQQAYDAGRRLRSLLKADDTVQFFTSPYRRTRETAEGILETLTSDNPEPSPFKRNNIKVYEEPRLREQDFGNFQPCSAEMERMWQERADYGHFFYRIPNGESAADAYDRVSGFNESLWRQFGDEDFASVCVLVTHGLMSRVFLMKWYHFSVEYFEDLRNVNHCEFLIMRKLGDSGKYTLESKLRTWSELRRERTALLKQKEEEAAREAATTLVSGPKEKDKDAAKLEKAFAGSSSPSSTALVPQRRWGGCPNGCNHDKTFKIRPGLADLIKRDGTNVYEKNSNDASQRPNGHGLSRRTTAGRRFEVAGYSDDDDGGDDIDEDNRASSPGSVDTGNENSSQSKDGSSAVVAQTTRGGTTQTPPQIDITRAREEIVSSPDATPSFITAEDRLRMASPDSSPPPPPKPFLHVGRDFGGTYSGHTSDADSSEDDRVRRRMARLRMNIGGSVSESNLHGPGSATASVAAHAHRHAYGSSDRFRYADLNAVADAATAGELLTASKGGPPSHHHDSSGSGSGNASASVSANTSVSGGVGGSSSGGATCSLRRKRTKNMANRLGDAPHCSDCEHGDTELDADEMDMDDDLMHSTIEDETDVDLTAAEKEDRSIQGSVY